MSVTINIPTIMHPLTSGERNLHAQGNTLGEIIANLEKTFPGIQQRLVKDSALVRFMNIYINDSDVRFNGGLSASVSDGDTITIIPAVAGG